MPEQAARGAAGRSNVGPVGFNPFRQQRRSPADYVMVAGAVLACVLLVLWALFGCAGRRSV